MTIRRKSIDKARRSGGPVRVRFTPALWAKWLKRFNEVPNLELRAGIEEMRARLATKERLKP